MQDHVMDGVMAEFKALALEFDTTIITPKAPPLTKAQQAEMDAWFANPYRFQDYIGLIR